jgi:hypothetical protein
MPKRVLSIVASEDFSAGDFGRFLVKVFRLGFTIRPIPLGTNVDIDVRLTGTASEVRVEVASTGKSHIYTTPTVFQGLEELFK